MKRDTFIHLLMTVEDFNEKINQLQTFTEHTCECLSNIMCSIIHAIETDMGLDVFDNNIESIIYDYCFRFEFGQEYNDTPLVTIEGRDYFPKRFTELYDVIIEMVGNAD